MTKDEQIALLRDALEKVLDMRFYHDGDCGVHRIAEDALAATSQPAQESAEAILVDVAFIVGMMNFLDSSIRCQQSSFDEPPDYVTEFDYRLSQLVSELNNIVERHSAKKVAMQAEAEKESVYAVRICPEADRECGDFSKGWCETCPKRRQESAGQDAKRLNYLETMLQSDSVELGISLYAGSKTLDGVVDKLFWVGALDSHYGEGACILGDDFGEGHTLREAIDAAMQAEAGKENK